MLTCLIGSVITPYIWSQIEPTTAIICACLTTYRPLFKGLCLPSLSSLTWISSQKTRSSSTDVEQATITSGDGRFLPYERPHAEHWSKFDFAADEHRQGGVNSSQELRSFQESSNKATNGGLKVFDGSERSITHKEPGSEKGSWLESPQSASRPGSFYVTDF